MCERSEVRNTQLVCMVEVRTVFEFIVGVVGIKVRIINRWGLSKDTGIISDGVLLSIDCLMVLFVKNVKLNPTRRAIHFS